jgi:hypothetical protein
MVMGVDLFVRLQLKGKRRRRRFPRHQQL